MPVFFNVNLVFNQLFLKFPFDRQAPATGLGQTIDRIHCEVKAVDIVQHRHIERRGDRALLLVTAHVNIVVIGPAVSQSVN